MTIYGNKHNHTTDCHCYYGEPAPLTSHDDFHGCPGICIYVCLQGMNSFTQNHHNHTTCNVPHSTGKKDSCCSPPPAPKPIHDVSNESISQMPTVKVNDQKDPKQYLDNKPTVRIYCKAKTNYSLTIRNGEVILAPTKPSDQNQHWIKDEKYGETVKDEQGFSSFALINKATGQAIKHSIGVTYPVKLRKYNPDKLDKTVLWTLGKKSDGGYKAIRAVDNIHLNLDGFEGIKECGGVRDGTRIVLWDWANGDNQKWTIVTYSSCEATWSSTQEFCCVEFQYRLVASSLPEGDGMFCMFDDDVWSI